MTLELLVILISHIRALFFVHDSWELQKGVGYARLLSIIRNFLVWKGISFCHLFTSLKGCRVFMLLLTLNESIVYFYAYSEIYHLLTHLNTYISSFFTDWENAFSFLIFILLWVMFKVKHNINFQYTTYVRECSVVLHNSVYHIFLSCLM